GAEGAAQKADAGGVVALAQPAPAELDEQLAGPARADRGLRGVVGGRLVPQRRGVDLGERLAGGDRVGLEAERVLEVVDRGARIALAEHQAAELAEHLGTPPR